MKKKYILIITAFVLSIITIYFLDKKFWMQQRINKHLWMYESGEFNIARDFIDMGYCSFSGDTIMFSTGKKAIVRYQYFGTLSIKDIETGNKATYVMKGTNWIESIWK